MTHTFQAHRDSTTGLFVVPAAGETGVRVYRDRKSPLDGHANEIVGPLQPEAKDLRGRWDTIGTTVYFADNELTAFVEVLMPFRKHLGKLSAAASRVGISASELAERIVEDAGENDLDEPWAISCDWQMRRSVAYVRLPARGWWVRVDHPDTLVGLGDLLSEHGGAVHVTAGDITGDDRDVTTYLAQLVRVQVLADGHLPLGISFVSKSLVGRCWAWWDRRHDDGLAPGGDDPVLESSHNVDSGNGSAFREAADRLGLPILPGRGF